MSDVIRGRRGNEVIDLRQYTPGFMDRLNRRVVESTLPADDDPEDAA